jgi:mono/diheme cytochrome c family protein
MSGPRSFAGFVGVALLGAVLGCGGSSSTPPTSGGMVAPVASRPADGKQVFEQHCQKCHALNGVGGKGKNPDLGKVGANHTADWIVEHTKNPKTHKPQSGMPAFEKTLTAEQLKAVGDYLAAKK